jgi:hypothetical protein
MPAFELLHLPHKAAGVEEEKEKAFSSPAF